MDFIPIELQEYVVEAVGGFVLAVLAGVSLWVKKKTKRGQK